MPKAVFSDEVVLATELKKNQRYWFERARKLGGVTVMQGKVADLVVAPRKKVAAGLAAMEYVKTIAPFLREVITLKRSPAESIIFPWLHGLNDEEQDEFVKELVDAFTHCSIVGEWQELDELLEDWQATAEAHRNPELMEAWRTRGRPEDHVPLE